MRKVIVAGCIFLFIFSNLCGMKSIKDKRWWGYSPISKDTKGYYYKNENLRFSTLEKNQLATIMLMVLEQPGEAIQELKDLENNNIFHLILFSHDKFVDDLVTDAFYCCLPYLNDFLLNEKNALKQSPLDLIEKLDGSLKQFYMQQLQDRKLVSESAKNANEGKVAAEAACWEGLMNFTDQ